MHPTDLFYFRLATQEREVEEDDGEHPDYVTTSEEDDILYTKGEEAVVDDVTTLLFIHQSEQSKYLMQLTNIKKIVFKDFAKCIIFVQVSKSCPYGRHVQNVQVGSSTLLSGHPHECWLLCSCRIYNST